MKKILVALLSSILLLNGCGSNGINHPTKTEWLEVYLTHEIEEIFNLWESGVAIRVGIYEKDKEIVVTITAKMGEQFPETARQTYIDTAKKTVEEILIFQDYEWAKDYRIIVDFV
jgi:hypothetical protein